MKFERAAVHTGKEIAAQPGKQNHNRADAKHKEANQKHSPVMKANFQQAVEAVTKPLECLLKALLKAYQGITAGGGLGVPLLSPQQVLRHGGDDSPRKEI